MGHIKIYCAKVILLECDIPGHVQFFAYSLILRKNWTDQSILHKGYTLRLWHFPVMLYCWLIYSLYPRVGAQDLVHKDYTLRLCRFLVKFNCLFVYSFYLRMGHIKTYCTAILWGCCTSTIWTDQIYKILLYTLRLWQFLVILFFFCFVYLFIPPRMVHIKCTALRLYSKITSWIFLIVCSFIYSFYQKNRTDPYI